jgi:hypothetical protein
MISFRAYVATGHGHRQPRVRPAAGGHCPAVFGLDALPRLAEVLFDATGSLDYEVSGETDGGNAFLSG